MKEKQTSGSSAVLADADELIDIVDDHDHVVRTMWRSEALRNKVAYTRVVIAFIRHIDGLFCYFRRAAHKSHPGALGAPGGAVQSGETYYQALVREMKEEILIDPAMCTVRELGLLHPHEWQMDKFRMIYEITVDSYDIAYNRDDFSECMWITQAELMQRARQGDIVTSDLVKRVGFFYPHLIERLNG